jgi:hypothetical protein
VWLTSAEEREAGWPFLKSRSWRTVKCAKSIAGSSKFASVESPCSTFVYFPIAGALVSKLQQAVFGVVPLATAGAFQIATPGGALPVIVFRDNKGSAATAWDKEHFQPIAFWQRRHNRSICQPLTIEFPLKPWLHFSCVYSPAESSFVTSATSG